MAHTQTLTHTHTVFTLLNKKRSIARERH